MKGVLVHHHGVGLSLHREDLHHVAHLDGGDRLREALLLHLLERLL
jgi:hypothetical protein